MLSNNQVKLYSSLRNKKYRGIHGKFLAEGEKIVLDIIHARARLFKIHSLVATSEFLKTQPQAILKDIPEIIEASDSTLEKISSLSTPNKAILVCAIPEYLPDFKQISGELSLFLDDIRDPGNLGTIMRTADWFGIHHIFCSRESVDVYNPKVVQSTMGAICRVRVYYTEPEYLLQQLRNIQSFPVIGTLLEGENIFTAKLPETGIIILGNESRGISEKLLDQIDLKLTIPSTRQGDEVSESLNVAAAAAIVMAEFRRNQAAYSK